MAASKRMIENSYLHKFKFAFTRLYPQLSEEEWDYIASNTTKQETDSKNIIIKAGVLQENIYYLTQGLVRGYYINENGNEVTTNFVNHIGWITHYSALLTQTPSKYQFQSLEASEYVGIPFSIVQSGYKKYKGLEKFGRLIAEQNLIIQQNRIESFQFLNAEQRYLNFIDNFPELYNRISLTHLSTYLGIQRQSLTRIRKKIHSQ